MDTEDSKKTKVEAEAEGALMEKFDEDLAALKQRLNLSTSAMHSDIEALSKAPMNQALAYTAALGAVSEQAGAPTTSTPGGSLVGGLQVAVMPWSSSLTSLTSTWTSSATVARSPSDASRRRVLFGLIGMIMLVSVLSGARRVGHSWGSSHPPSMFYYEPRAPAASLTATDAAMQQLASNSTSARVPRGGELRVNASDNPSDLFAAPGGHRTARGADAMEAPKRGTKSAETAVAELRGEDERASLAQLDAADVSSSEQRRKANISGAAMKAGIAGGAAASTMSKGASLRLASALGLPAVPKSSKSCTPLNKFDATEEKCDTSCAITNAKFHCKLCKCKACAFCLAVPAKAAESATTAAPKGASAAKRELAGGTAGGFASGTVPGAKQAKGRDGAGGSGRGAAMGLGREGAGKKV